MMFRGIEQKTAEGVSSIEDNRHGYRVADPNQCDRERKIDAKKNGKTCSHDHLAWQWDESHKEANSKSARCRATIQAPKIGIVKQIAKDREGLLLADHIVFWKKFSNCLLKHRYLIHTALIST